MIYKEILRKIYKEIDPSKIPSIPKMLEKSEGREEDLIRKVINKYQDQLDVEALIDELNRLKSPAPIEAKQPIPVPAQVSHANTSRKSTPPPLKSPRTDSSPNSGKQKKNRILIGIVALVFVSVGGFFLIRNMVLSNYEYLYVVANKVDLFSKPIRSNDFRLKGERKKYSEEVIVYGTVQTGNGKWVKTTHKGDTVYFPLRFLCDKQEFEECNSIYGNTNASEQVVHSFNRRGIREYYIANNLMGELSDNVQNEIYGEVKNREVWQVFGEDPNSEFNVYAEGKFSGTEFGTYPTAYPFRPDDFAVILSRKNDQKVTRKILFFMVNRYSEPKNYASFDLSDYPGYFIKSVYGEEPVLKEFAYLDRYMVKKERPGIVLSENSGYGIKYLITYNKKGLKISPSSYYD